MIRFIYGANGLQRNHILLSESKRRTDLCEETVLLVPEQETVSVEQYLTRHLPPAAQLIFEVSNFSRLANRTFRTVGGLGFTYATPGAKALIMFKVLKKTAPLLRQYGKEVGDLRLTERMLSAVAEFKAYCIPPEALTEALALLPENEPLSGKLHDLSLIYAAYQGELNTRFQDAADDLSRAAQLIAANPTLYQNTHFYLASFTDFTGQELALIRLLMARGASFTVLSPLPAATAQGIHLASAQKAELQLVRFAKESGKRIFRENMPVKRPETVAELLERDLFNLQAEPAPLHFTEGGALSITVAESPYEEAEYAATLIAKAVREGARYQDFAIVVRDAATYTGILDAALERENIPFYLSEKTDITLSPLIKLLLFALRIGRYGWQQEDVVGYLKTGLTGIGADDINLFEEYAALWKMAGGRAYSRPFTMNPDGYTQRRSPRAARILAGAERVRAALYPPLAHYLSVLEKPGTAPAYAKATYDFLLALGVPEAMKSRAAERLGAGRRREAEEDTRLFGILTEALETVAESLAEETLDISDFFDVLTLLFATKDIGVIPTSSDEVLVGSADTLRMSPPDTVIVMGLCDGLFPPAVKERGMLSDAEKHRLAELGLSLSADMATTASDELFFLYRALTLPRRRLCLTYPKAMADGKHTEPSMGITRVRALFPQLAVTDFAAVPVVQKIFSSDSALSHLRELSDTERAALLGLWQDKPRLLEQTKRLQIPVTDKEAHIPAEAAATLFHDRSFNPTGLEKFVSCRFAYYCDKILRLRQEPSDTLDAAAVGTFIHFVLEKTVAAAKESGDFSAVDETALNRIVAKSVADYRAYLTEAGGGITPRAEALLLRLTSLARIVAGALVEEFADSDFTPVFFELDLSQNGQSAMVQLPDGGAVPLSGKADRVDLYRGKDGQAYLRIADYKTGRKAFSREDISKGFCLQMPLYLYALCRQAQPELARALGLPVDTRFFPAGVTYLSTAVGNENTDARIPKEQALRDAAARIKREGLLPADEALLSAISKSQSSAVLGPAATRKKRLMTSQEFEGLFDELASTVGRISKEMKSGSATVAPVKQGEQSPCAFCAFSPVCRGAEKTK